MKKQTEALHRLNKFLPELQDGTKEQPKMEVIKDLEERNGIRAKRSIPFTCRIDIETSKRIEDLAQKYHCTKTEILIAAIKNFC